MFLPDQISHFAKQTPLAIAVSFGGEHITFAQLNERVVAAHHVLVNTLNVRRGDRVAYMGLNHPDMLVLLFACAKIGAIFNPLNSRLVRDEYNFLLSDARPVVCFYDVEFAAIVNEVEHGKVRFEPLAILHESQAGSDLVNSSETPANAGDQPILLVYTSGTTGRPKGVLLTQDALWANIENCQAYYAFEPGDRVLITLPLFHVGGLCILLLPALTHGATIFLHQRFDPAATFKDLQEQRITTTILVPAQMGAMMGMPQWAQCDLSSLKCVVVGSSIIPLAQIQSLHARGIPASQIYGATETGPAAIGLEIDAAMSHEGAAGTPAKLCEVQVRDPDRNALGAGKRGEIWVKGPNILSEYWRNPIETSKVLVDGWYNTGDIGYCDDDGYYWIVDRAKDMIISGGENIYPAEVEAACALHPAISVVAVVGRADERWGETPVATIELKPGASLTLDELLAFLDDKLARYKRPTDLLVYTELPRNTMGKIDKPTLRKQLADV
jgi:fatty-acyl-CoA synthase